MFELFSRNRNCQVIRFLWIILCVNFLHAQDPKKIPEKIYLHTDRSVYFIDENLWYKAYTVNAYNNLLYDNSNILYVELISSDAKIVAQNKTNIEVGIGHGDFQLKDSLGIKPGHYQLRAYTNWNRNFGEDFVFKKNIEIINVFDDNSKSKTAQNNTAALVKTLTTGVQNTTTVDFFPEGGSLLENVASVVGFKSVDNNGNPIDVNGEIFDSNNELVTPFASSHDGMGKFQIIPISGKNYYAKIKTLAGTELRAELPKAAKNGYLLSYKVFKGRNFITINTNPETLLQNPNGVFTVICKAKGINYLETTKILTETSFSFELEKNIAPDGISQITLYDSNSKPQSERLIYIENEPDLDVQLTTEKTIYKPNEKIALNISSKSKTGEAKSASFSVSATDMNGIVSEKDYETTISSYFLMESDIRGKVFNPGYYFDTTNLKRLEHLDNLLLTQGWRDFLWKTTLQLKNSTNYIAEKGITISGRVKQVFADKPLVNNKIVLALINKKHMNIFNDTTDSNGLFKFENLMFSGKTTMYLSSRNEKGKFKGELLLDSIQHPPIVAPFKNDPIVWSESTQTIVKNVFKKFTAFGVKPENILDEVRITAKKKYKTLSTYGIPEFSYVADESAITSTSIYELIEQKIPGVVQDENSVRFTRYQGRPLIIIDGMIDNTGLLSYIQPEDVIKIEAVKGSQATFFYGSEAENGIISVFTNGNNGVNQKKQTVHSIKKDIIGFYTERIFYVPNPEKPNPEFDSKEPVRNTLYWNPYVHPDKTGNAKVSYNNSSVETKVKVDLEGITAAGIPVVKKIYYTIKK